MLSFKQIPHAGNHSTFKSVQLIARKKHTQKVQKLVKPKEPKEAPEKHKNINYIYFFCYIYIYF